MPSANQQTPADPLMSVDYDPIDHLNKIFTHPSTLSSAPAVSSSLSTYQNDLDSSISLRVQQQISTHDDSIQRIQAAKSELSELFAKIDSVRDRALKTELNITDMTADIKRLDNTKRNLTLSMTALKRLQMLTTAYEQLRGLGKARRYEECAQLLGAVIQLMAHFKSYRSIDQIAMLGRKVADCQRELLEQVCEDFELTFAKGEVKQKRTTLAEACMVLDALGENSRGRLITWYCNTMLREYRQIFRGDEAGSLDNISRRYSWFNRMLKTYDQEHASIFPPHWRVNELLANSFCESTRDDFKNILQQSVRRSDGQSLNVDLLLSCLQETLDFEQGLEKKLVPQGRGSVDTVDTEDERPSKPFDHAISEAFEPYLSLWVEAQDTHLATLIPKYKQQPIRNNDEEFSPTMVIPSSGELFQFYRVTFAQCAKLSTGNRLLELSKTFAKYLDQYSQQILWYFLGDRNGQQDPSIEDTIVILNTADYCYLTCNQLEEKIKHRIDEQFKSDVDLQNQADTFMGIAGASVRSLVRKIEIECEPAWREMRNTGWSRLENVGDQSTYVGELTRQMNATSTEILKLLQKQQYFRAFCDNLAESITNTYIANIALCKPISEVGAEQMLLDFYVLKRALTDLPSLASEKQQASQSSYAKRVTQTTAKIDPLLKTLQVRSSPPEALVQAYLIHIADRSDANFKKILELKGIIRRQDVSELVELFHAHRVNHPGELAANSTLLSSLQVQAPTQASTVGMGALSNVGATMSSQSLSLLTAASDRFVPGSMSAGSTSQQGSAVPSRVASPPQGGTSEGQPSQPANLNDNLRNIGKFFRRDMSAFGRFGKANDQ